MRPRGVSPGPASHVAVAGRAPGAPPAVPLRAGGGGTGFRVHAIARGGLFRLVAAPGCQATSIVRFAS
jgi:hypothetical protein